VGKVVTEAQVEAEAKGQAIVVQCFELGRTGVDCRVKWSRNGRRDAGLGEML